MLKSAMLLVAGTVTTGQTYTLLRTCVEALEFSSNR